MPKPLLSIAEREQARLTGQLQQGTEAQIS
jgi:hypothetical protein